MNSYTISLSSNNTNTTEVFDTIDLYDYTRITIDMDNIYSKTLPIFVTIDWGDGKQETYDNDLYLTLKREDINIFNPTPLLTTDYIHDFYPSQNNLYKTYYIQVMVYSSSLEYSIFTIPIKIRTNDYFESIHDMSLINVNILPVSNNPKEFQFKTTLENQLIELRDDY